MSENPKNGKRLLKKLEKMGAVMAGKKLSAVAKAGALPIVNEWKQSMEREPTTVKTRTYKRSVQPEVVEESASRAIVHIGTDIVDPPYPLFLEFGTSRMKARPKARPAFHKKKKAAIAATKRALLAVLKESIR